MRTKVWLQRVSRTRRENISWSKFHQICWFICAHRFSKVREKQLRYRSQKPQSTLDWKIQSLALEIVKCHLKNFKIQSFFQVLQKSNFNRIFKRNVHTVQPIFHPLFNRKSVSSHVFHSSAHHLAVDSWMAWRAIQPKKVFQGYRAQKIFPAQENASRSSPKCFTS